MDAFFHRRFNKNYAKLSRKLQVRTDRRIQLFLKNPMNPLLNNHSLQGEREGFWSINISGDYRAVYRFIDKNNIEFIDIGTHSELYE